MSDSIKEKDGVRTFDTGATRTAEGDKFDYEGFLSPAVIERFGQYMHKHRKQADGTLRASDNWQKGMPISAYIKSLFRHFVTSWTLHRRYWQPDLPGIGAVIYTEQEDNLCAILFNAQGALHEILKQKAAAQTTTARLLEGEPEALFRQREFHRKAQDAADAIRCACSVAGLGLLEKLYQFEGVVYREGETRPPRRGEVYLSEMNGLHPVRAMSDRNSIYTVLTPYKK